VKECRSVVLEVRGSEEVRWELLVEVEDRWDSLSEVGKQQDFDLLRYRSIGEQLFEAVDKLRPLEEGLW